MLSAWKRFLNKGTADNDTSNPNGSSSMPPGIQKLDKELQRKFARGVNYNMKVVIKGDNRVGKTSLFLRLKGYGFEDNYTPTETLNVTSIDWNYKATDDIVKIDLWEAIDATSRKNVNFVDLKMENNIENVAPNENPNGDSYNSNNNNCTKHNVSSKVTVTNTRLSPSCNNNISPIPESAKLSLAELSENLDVYKGADAVLLVMDMTKSWTFKYIQAEFSKIPKHIPVLVVANHRDQGHHRTVTTEQVRAFLDGFDRNPSDGIVMYTEASMKNGFGLSLIEKFFNIPFLKLQEASLLKQLELNRREFSATYEELHLMQESTNKDYEQYLEIQTIKRRQQADAMSPINSGLRQLDEATREQIRNATISSDVIDKRENLKSIASNKPASVNVMASQNFVNDRLPSIVIGAKCPLPETKPFQLNTQQPLKSEDSTRGEGASIKGADGNESDDSDEEEIPYANPLVAHYQSDLDSDDQIDSTTK